VPGEGARIAKPSWRRNGLLGAGFDAEQLARSTFGPDRAAPNGSTISLIAEYGGRRVLLLGDAHAGPTAAALDRLGPGPHRFDAVKLAHHGSRANTSLALLGRLRSDRWIVSTNGARFRHPNNECLGRVVVTQRRPTFFLNYTSEHTEDLIEGAGDDYRVRLPRKNDGITISL
jgi:hypothetical protein